MHEYSIVQSWLDQCEDNAKVNDTIKVTKVVVGIGVMSGVEPDLLQTCIWYI
jgi:hydrogenase nickel incorporation protein HypA/HybF